MPSVRKIGGLILVFLSAITDKNLQAARNMSGLDAESGMGARSARSLDLCGKPLHLSVPLQGFATL